MDNNIDACQPVSKVSLPTPYNEIQPIELAEVAQILTALFKRPETCISKNQLKSVAQTAIAKCHIAETRLLNLTVLVAKMGKAINGLADTNVAKDDLVCYHNLVASTLNGVYHD